MRIVTSASGGEVLRCQAGRSPGVRLPYRHRRFPKRPPARRRTRDVEMRFGYKASAEQFAPRPLLDFAVAAERHGFDTIAVSDHFQPWRHRGGHAPSSLAWLGALGE